MNLAYLALLLALSADAGTSTGGRASPLAPPRPAEALQGGLSPTVEGGYALRVQGQGYLYQGPQFDARVGPDGSVSFKDRHRSAGFVPFKWVDRFRVTAPQRRPPWTRAPNRERIPSRMPERDGVCPPDSSCGTPIPFDQQDLKATGRYSGLGDEVLTSLGEDPYAAEKADFLSATFEFRMRLAVDARAELMKESLDFFPQRLDALWSDTRYSPRERRRILFDLWYQSSDTPAGKRAAGMIELFVKRRLPCGSPDAYTPAELAAFHAAHPERDFTAGACQPPQLDR